MPSGKACTVNKLRSINLLFSCMLRIERKIVHFGTKKSSRYISNKFTLNSKMLVLLLLMRKITQRQEKGKKYLNLFKFASFLSVNVVQQ
jgi:hypothetical protein